MSLTPTQYADLQLAAAILEEEAISLRESYALSDGHWPDDDDSQIARADFERFTALAGRLREMAAA